MPFTVRPARVEDAAAIAHVQVASWRSTYAGIVPADFLAAMNEEEGATRWQAQLAEGSPSIFVVETSAGVVGFAACGPLRAPIGDITGELYVIYLLQSAQGQGAGRALLAAVAAALLSAGLSSMAVWVLAANPAIAFYRILGAVQIAETTIEIGGAPLADLAFGWTDLNSLLVADGR